MNRHIERATKKTLKKNEQDNVYSFVINGQRYPQKYDIDYNNRKYLEYFDLMDTLATKTDPVSVRQLEKMQQTYGTRDEYFLKTALIVSEYESVAPHDGERKKELISKYFSVLNQEIPLFDIECVNTTECPECGGELSPMAPEDALYCEDCGVTQQISMNNSSRNYTYQQMRETSFAPKYSYDRLSHFTDKLAQIQAKENTHVSEEHLERIRAEIRKENVPDSVKFTRQFIIKMLKRANLPKLYENSLYILKTLYPEFKPLKLDSQAEETLKEMFKMIEKPFEKHKNLMKETVSMNERKSFLNYSYVLRKCFEILDMPEFAELCPLLKDEDKIKTYDKVWRLICDELCFPFYASV